VPRNILKFPERLKRTPEKEIPKADDLESLITALHVNFPETFAANSPAKEGGVNRKGSSPPPPAPATPPPPRSIQGLGERENARGDEMQLLQVILFYAERRVRLVHV
jgi:hypothetical protein